MLDQQSCIFVALAHGWDTQSQHVESIQQLLAKTPLADFRLQDAIGGREHPNVDPPRLGLSDSSHLTFLQNSQELCLRSRRQLSDLVEQQATLIGRLEQAGAVLRRAGEGTADAAKQLRLEQFIGQRRAVDGAEASSRWPAQQMERPGNQLLAGAALAGDEHRIWRVRDASNR